ncbi:MAG: hemerythrin domain-containing protein [Elusimicrobia bacterium]|nr:hemerythrin domain-containing protein [Elusimicrobiota bacterium]
MGPLASFLSADHDRLDALLQRADGDAAAYEEFRRGLLRHVGMEEMILLPAVKKLTGSPAALAAKIRLDHGALTALLIPSPTPLIVAAIVKILVPHNELEERDGGLYAECEKALGAEAPRVLADLRNARDIPPAAHVDGPHVLASVRRAIAAAGHGPLI